MGGLASTAFWPASLKGLEWFGWRDTLLIFAALEIALCLPLHLLFIPPSTGAVDHGKAARRKGAAASLGQRRAAFVWLAIAFAFNGFIVSVLTVYLITSCKARPDPRHAVWVGTFFGRCRSPAACSNLRSAALRSRSIGIAALSRWSSRSSCCLR
jgi:hypothetical protein